MSGTFLQTVLFHWTCVRILGCVCISVCVCVLTCGNICFSRLISYRLKFLRRLFSFQDSVCKQLTRSAPRGWKKNTCCWTEYSVVTPVFSFQHFLNHIISPECSCSCRIPICLSCSFLHLSSVFTSLSFTLLTCLLTSSVIIIENENKSLTTHRERKKNRINNAYFVDGLIHS